MNKRWVPTAAAAVFSLVFALGGWLLTNGLIERQHAALMHTVHTVEISEPSVPEQSAAPEPVTLSIKEMADIVNLWNSNHTEHYHDPVEGQLTMEDAIMAAKDGLSYFCESGALPKEILADDFTETSAFLYAMGDDRGTADVLAPAYSYWSIILNNRDVSIKLTLNAYTGRIWMANICSYSPEIVFDDVKMLDVINMFETYLDLPGGGSLLSYIDNAAKTYENQLVIIAQKRMGESDQYHYFDISMMTPYPKPAE